MKFEKDELVRITEGFDRGRIGFIQDRVSTNYYRVILDGNPSPVIYFSHCLARLSAIERLALVRTWDT